MAKYDTVHLVNMKEVDDTAFGQYERLPQYYSDNLSVCFVKLYLYA